MWKVTRLGQQVRSLETTRSCPLSAPTLLWEMKSSRTGGSSNCVRLLTESDPGPARD